MKGLLQIMNFSCKMSDSGDILSAHFTYPIMHYLNSALVFTPAGKWQQDKYIPVAHNL